MLRWIKQSGGGGGGVEGNVEISQVNGLATALAGKMSSADNQITDAKLADVPTATLKGRASAGTGDPENLTSVQVKQLLGLNNVNNTSDANKPVSTAQQTALNAKAPLDSPTFTGTPTAPTPSPGTNTGQLATTAFVAAAVAALVNASPAQLDTINELAAALGNDPNFATSMTNALAAKAPLASPTFTGTPAAPTPEATDNSTRVATTAFVHGLQGKLLRKSVTASSYTLLPADAGLQIEAAHATGIDIELPGDAAQAIPVDTVITVCQAGAGAVSFVAGAGVTLLHPASKTPESAGTHELVMVHKIAANTFRIGGGLAEGSPA